MSTVNSTSAVNANEQTSYAQNADTARTNQTNADGEAFSALLSEAISGLTTNTGIDTTTGMMGMPSTFLPITSLTDSLEQAITTASTTGSSEDAMKALLMLMMMMQTSSGGNTSMMMQMMASMIGNMQDKEGLRSNFIGSSAGANPYIMDRIDSEVFKYNPPEVIEAEQAELPLAWWKPTQPVLVSSEYDRDPELYRAVVDQFNVETAERYRPGREGYTFCNVYVWDVTRAMGAEVPYYSDPVTAAPREYPDIKGANYNGAIAMDRWLKTHGEKFGWRQVTPEEAQMHANQGRPAVTTAGDIGHVQMIVPSKDGSFDPIRGVTIAQAGRIVTNYAKIRDIYGSSALNNKVTYWVHD